MNTRKPLFIFQLAFLTLCGLVLASGCNAKKDKEAGLGNESDEIAQQEQGGGVGQWASDQWNSAVSAGSETVDDSTEWVSQLYKSAKEAGTTTASNTADWVKEDWNSQGDWEYQIMQLDSTDVQAVQNTLNEAGKSRWDCYHVERTDQQWTFFMKRQRRSYLSKLPLRDLTRLLPMGIGGSDEE